MRVLILALAIMAGVAAPIASAANAGPCNNAVGKWTC
jgi:hypothetical protein